MARQVISKTVAPGPDPTAGILIVWTAADIANFEQFAWTGQEIILVWNTHATTGYTFTVTSRADERGRSLDIATQAIAAGAIYVIDPLSSAGWRQTDGNVYLQASNASVKWAVITTKGRAN